MFVSEWDGWQKMKDWFPVDLGVNVYSGWYNDYHVCSVKIVGLCVNMDWQLGIRPFPYPEPNLAQPLMGKGTHIFIFVHAYI